MCEVSVILINYNKPDLTLRCISSVYEKTSGVSFELIVVDNASVEGDLSTIEEQFPDVRIIRSTTNLGFAGGNNLGLRHTKGNYLLLLNNDTELMNDAITECHRFLQQNGQVGVVSCQLVYPDGNIQHNCQRFPSMKYRLFELLRLQKVVGRKIGGRLLLGSFFNHSEVVYPDWIWGTFFMFPKRVLNLFAGHQLPASFFMYWEDVQWCWEIRKKGYEIAFTPNARVIHLMNGSGGVKSSMMLEGEQKFMDMYYTSYERFLVRTIDKWLT